MLDAELKLARDINKIQQISIIPTLLDVICRSTGMGFAAVARVTQNRWIACNVKDEINFGLLPGGELKIETTICNEIRDHHQPVIIDHVDKSELYNKHHTPLLYGFQSYISVPITRKNGDFFGTLCAIDHLEMIFYIFMKIDNDQPLKGEGTGLANCRKIVRNHRGMITAESEPVRGTTFSIMFPVDPK